MKKLKAKRNRIRNIGKMQAAPELNFAGRDTASSEWKIE
jgi:hypothetical protein